MRQKTRRKNRDPPIKHKIFRYQKILETQKGSTYEISCHYETQKVTKNVILPLSIVFRYQKLSETTKDPPQEVFHGDRKFSTFFCNTTFYISPKFLQPTNVQHQKFSETPETSKNTKRAPSLNFRYYETKIFRQFFCVTLR